MQFRIITYNIHKGIGGVDRRYRPERITETLAAYQPDLVLLQEVDDGCRRSRRHCQVELFGDALGLPHRAFQPNVKLREGWYGNAILSRYPLSDVDDLELTVRFKKRRRALVARVRPRFDQHSRSLWLFNLHLGLAGMERTIQLRRFLCSDALIHSHDSTPVIVAGDFNDTWGTLGRRLLRPAGFQPACDRVKTYPAFLPMRALDGIYFRGTLELLHSFASRSRLARRASDHLPLVAEFELHAQSATLSDGPGSAAVPKTGPTGRGPLHR